MPTQAPQPWGIKGAGKVGTRSAQRPPLAHPNPALSLSSALPSHPSRGSFCPPPGFPCVSPFSHVCAAPPRSERCPWASLLLPCSACGAVPSPLLSSASARNAMLVVPPGGGRWGRAGAKEWEGSAHGGDWEVYQPSVLESLPCPRPPPHPQLLHALWSSGLRWLRVMGVKSSTSCCGTLLTLPSGPCPCSGLISYTGTAADSSSSSPHQPEGPKNLRPLEFLSYSTFKLE